MISIKSFAEIELIRKSCKITANVLSELGKYVDEGISTQGLDDIASKLIAEQKAVSAFKGYHGFPGNICTSINEEVIHGIPSNRKLKKGDIIGIDVGVKKDGFYGDAAKTFIIGVVNGELEKLVKVTEMAFYKGLEQAIIGNRIGNISFAIQNFVESFYFSVVKDFSGHGIGRNLHEEPKIPNFGQINEGPYLREGMVFTIEPMVNIGGSELEIASDNWTVITKDKKKSAHFEHTIVITKNGPEILSL